MERASPDPAHLSPEAEAEHWRQWREREDLAAREALVNHYLPFARIMAGKVFAGRHHDEFEFDEYLQYATVGLLESIDRYHPDRGAVFKTFAGQRITGAILSGIERLSEKQQQISTRQRLRAERLASLNDATQAPDDPADLFKQLADIALGLAVSYMLEDSGLFRDGEPSGPDNSYARLELKQLQQQVRALVDGLPDRERKVVRYHYLQHLPFESIATMLGVTKGRISQIHKTALTLLREEIARRRHCDLAW